MLITQVTRRVAQGGIVAVNGRLYHHNELRGMINAQVDVALTETAANAKPHLQVFHRGRHICNARQYPRRALHEKGEREYWVTQGNGKAAA